MRGEFWDFVDTSGGPDACWPWLRSLRQRTGYGQVKHPLGVTAHRVAYVLTNGPAPAGLVVRHTCDNRACCNPRHLILGTRADNSRDMVERGRQAFGNRHPNARLTAELVQELRRRHATGETCSALAREIGIGRTTVGRALRHETWITEPLLEGVTA